MENRNNENSENDVSGPHLKYYFGNDHFLATGALIVTGVLLIIGNVF